MKAKIFLLSIATLLVSMVSFSQDTSIIKKDNLVFLLRQSGHINQAIKTIEQLKTHSSTIKTGKVVIIVCGDAVKSLTTEEASGWVNKLKVHPEVEIVACGLSLNQFKVNQKDLVPGIIFTENGFIKSFELQKAGYLSVEL